MKTLILKRQSTFEDGTFGVLLDGVRPFAVTLERQWLDNKKNESCIPEGEYVCRRVISPRFGETFEVTDVPNRTYILFHKGNIEEHSRGCILIGEQFESLNGKTAVLRSGKGYNEFMDRLKGEDAFLVNILWA
jgi:hypothetical protein